ncbi:MAG: putative lipid II flippase FtsW [Gammaproteobacteria bacterium]
MLKINLLAYDRSLFIVSAILLATGLVVLTSSSMALSHNQNGFAFFYAQRQVIYMFMGLFAGYIFLVTPLYIWQKISRVLLLLSFLLLILVLIPGVGHEVNGARRWITFGFFNIQVSEIAKLCLLIYFADYVTRRHFEITSSGFGFIKALIIVSLMAGLLLLQPDFGTAVVILSTILAVLFLAGAPLHYFILMVIGLSGVLAALAVSAPYRWQRITSFLNPWADQYASGYQLTQALIAFGRGEWFGLGLGSGIQKLFYLPEAHTDFIFAVLSEELGLIGALIILFLYALLIYRGMHIAKVALNGRRFFQAYLAYGITLCLALQVIVSIGVNTGLLPTKGLTLPLMSYGGSSLIVTMIFIALLLRISFENQNTN